MELSVTIDTGQSVQLSNCREGKIQLVTVGTGIVGLFSEISPGDASNNEDSAIVAHVSATQSVIAVADGVGGSRSGHDASQLALKIIGKRLAKCTEDLPIDDLRPVILNGIEEANQAVLDLGVGACCTLALAELNGSSIRPYHVGDSSILVCSNRGTVRLQTIDHSPTGYGVEGGFLDAKESLFHEERHLVSNVLGQDQMRIEVGSQQELSARDTVVVASDGLFDNLHTDEVIEHVRSGPLDESLSNLVSICRKRMTDPAKDAPSKPDDLTILIYRQNIGD